MKRFLLATLVILTAAFSFSATSSVTAKSRTFEMTYTAKIKALPQDAKDIDIWIPYPTSDESQEILDMKVETPYPASVSYDKEFGNGILHLSPSPGAKAFNIKMTFKVKRDEISNKGLDKDPMITDIGDAGQFQRYLAPSKYAVINQKVKDLAAKATKGRKGIAEKAKGSYDFILENMSYNKKIPGWGKGDVDRLCFNLSEGAEGTGNCTDFHSLFGSMMRSIGVPVVFEMGFPLMADKDLPEGRTGGYHCWARFYLPGTGWVPVDISEADKAPGKKDYFFGSICENRVRFSRGRDILLEPNQHGERLNYFGPDPYIEIDGVSSDLFERTISYRDL